MAESDVLAAIVDLDDDVKNVKNKVKNIQDSLDALMDPTKKLKIWIDCYHCKGDGLVLNTGYVGLDPVDVGVPQIPPPPVEQITCPICKGAKKFVWGWQETNPEVTP